MLKEIDTRDFGFYAESTAQFEALGFAAEAFSASLPGDQAIAISRVNTLTGTPQIIRAVNAVPLPGSLINQALALVQRTSPVLGFADSGPSSKAEFVPDPRVQATSSGSSVVHLHQYYRGIPVFAMARSVAFSSDQTPQTIVGDNVDFADEPDLIPAIDVKQAMLHASEYINANQVTKSIDGWGVTKTQRRINTSKYVPKVLATFSLSSQPTVLDKGVFADPIPAHLVLFHQGSATRLGWHFIVSLPRGRGQYRIIVAADRKEPVEILYVRHLTLTLKGTGKVHPHTGANPRQSISFPRPLSAYQVPVPVGLPVGFPLDWIDDQVFSSGSGTVARSVGNNVLAGRVVGGQLQPALGNVVNNAVDFDPTNDPDQHVLNVFYFVNFLHDFFYLMGFDEASGNFQETNVTGQGFGTDSVIAAVFDDPVSGTASMGTQVDSLNPIMRMGLYANSNRHTALDADVVFHEFVHGVTNRLVGGPVNVWSLDAPQSRGMGEGWSDYFALTILNFMRNQNKLVVGDWVVDDNAGIRSHPYDDSYPGHFGLLGKSGPYEWEEHNIGEIWCATLMAMTRRIIAACGDRDGYVLSWRLVMDGLRLAPANPGFLDARDAILRALDDLHSNGKLDNCDYNQVRRAAWEAFAKFGMGPGAESMIGPGLLRDGQGIVADFNLPPGV